MTSFRGDRRDSTDAIPGDELPPAVSPLLQVGASGLKRTSGYVDEEFLPQLRGRKAIKVFREMGDNSPVIGGWFAAVSELLRQIEWPVEPASSKPEDRANAEFIEQCMGDMEHSWGDMITEIASFCLYGWELSEPVYKMRVGPWEKDAKKRSKYTDNRFGWRKIEGRSQETLLRWLFGPDGEILGMVQQAPPDYKRRVIDMKRALLFRTTVAKNNPEGRSLIRNCYEPWYYLKRHQEIEAVGVARDLAGLPIAKIPSKYLSAPANTPDGAMREAIRKIVTSISRNESEGLLWPNDVDGDTKLPEMIFELMSSGGSRQFDTESIINRYKTEMLQAVLADFMQVGHESNGGSYALHTDKSGLFRTSINALAQMIADVFNRQAIPRLFELNGIKPSELPRIVPNSVDPPDLGQLAQFMSATGALGMQWFPDPVLDKALRSYAGVPKLDDSMEHVLEQQQRQQAVLNLANQKLQAIQVDQQAMQGQMQTEQQEMGMAQQRAALEAPPEQEGQAEPAADPNDAKRSDIGVQTDKVKLDQEKAKLSNLRKPPAAAARKNVAKRYRYLPNKRMAYDGHPDPYTVEDRP